MLESHTCTCYDVSTPVVSLVISALFSLDYMHDENGNFVNHFSLGTTHTCPLLSSLSFHGGGCLCVLMCTSALMVHSGFCGNFLGFLGYRTFPEFDRLKAHKLSYQKSKHWVFKRNKSAFTVRAYVLDTSCFPSLFSLAFSFLSLLAV